MMVLRGRGLVLVLIQIYTNNVCNNITMKDSTYKKYCLVVDESFVNGFNGTKAWQKYYPKSKDETAAIEFNRILRIPKVAKYKESIEKKLSKDNEFGRQELFKKLLGWLESDSTEILDISVDSIKSLPLEVRKMIVTKVVHSGDNKKVELSFVDKAKTADMIAKMIGAYEKHNEQKNKSYIVENLNSKEQMDLQDILTKSLIKD